MYKVISVVKKWWMKVVSVICAALISFLTLHPCLSVVVLASGAGAVIGSILDWAGYVSSAVEILSPLFDNTPGSLIETKYLCAWMDIIKDSGLSEEDFRSYYSEIVTRSEEWSIGSDEYKTLLFIQDTAAAGVSLDAICYLAYHGTGTDDFIITDDNKFQVTGSGFKSIMTDYSLMYAPMPTPSQYIYSYQTVTGKTQGKYFYPYAPVYRYGKGWGCNVGQSSGWTNGCYVLGFLEDDDVGSALYAEYYCHFFFTKDDDGSVFINSEVISLADGSVVGTSKAAYVSQACYGLESYSRLGIYSTDFKYLTNDNSGISYFQFSYPKYNYYYSGKITEIVKTPFITYFNATTFTPATNTADDWGYIMSETPFELFANQTSIDFSRIPDNYYITINGDTIYDYNITNPDTDDTTTIKKYIDDDYDFPTAPDVPDVPDPGDDPTNPGVSGNVTVSGNVGVNGKIEIETKPIDVNINVNSGGSSGSGTVEVVDLSEYFSTLPEQSETMNDYLKNFFSFLPPQVLALLLGGIACAVLCRVLGR